MQLVLFRCELEMDKHGWWVDENEPEKQKLDIAQKPL